VTIDSTGSPIVPFRTGKLDATLLVSVEVRSWIDMYIHQRDASSVQWWRRKDRDCREGHVVEARDRPRSAVPGESVLSLGALAVQMRAVGRAATVQTISDITSSSTKSTTIIALVAQRCTRTRGYVRPPFYPEIQPEAIAPPSYRLRDLGCW
jgi:hypothetical protein